MQNAELEMQNAECTSSTAEGGPPLAAAQSPSRENNTQLFSNTFGPFPFPDREGNVQNTELGPQNAETNSPSEESHTDSKAHLTSSVPRAARLPQGALTKSQLAEMREIFGTIDDAEIHRLYKRVTK